MSRVIDFARARRIDAEMTRRIEEWLRLPLAERQARRIRYREQLEFHLPNVKVHQDDDWDERAG